MTMTDRLGSASGQWREPVFALDFDGVLCDSVTESAVTAWRAGRVIWPEWRGDEPPAECLRRYQALRPVVETGYQTLLLLRLIWLDQQPRSVMANRFLELGAAVLRETGRTATQLAYLFGQARDRWIADDPTGWFKRQRFYPGVFETFVNAWRNGTPIYILTTKQERFVLLLLQQSGIDFPVEHVFGLERRQSKEAVLERLLHLPTLERRAVHFVEDRLATLLRVNARADLNPVRLYLADWGYNTPEQRHSARVHPRITVWSARRFLQV
jgi:phosphoglycolate phosphatase-like HAD superfamily hydrolase